MNFFSQMYQWSFSLNSNAVSCSVSSGRNGSAVKWRCRGRSLWATSCFQLTDLIWGKFVRGNISSLESTKNLSLVSLCNSAPTEIEVSYFRELLRQKWRSKLAARMGGLEGDSTQCPFSPKPKLPTGIAAISEMINVQKLTIVTSRTAFKTSWKRSSLLGRNALCQTNLLWLLTAHYKATKANISSRTN